MWSKFSGLTWSNRRSFSCLSIWILVNIMHFQILDNLFCYSDNLEKEKVVFIYIGGSGGGASFQTNFFNLKSVTASHWGKTDHGTWNLAGGGGGEWSTVLGCGGGGEGRRSFNNSSWSRGVNSSWSREQVNNSCSGEEAWDNSSWYERGVGRSTVFGLWGRVGSIILRVMGMGQV